MTPMTRPQSLESGRGHAQPGSLVAQKCAIAREAQTVSRPL